jgi:hypothetical protein
MLQAIAAVLAVTSLVPMWAVVFEGRWESVGHRGTLWAAVAQGSLADRENLVLLLCVLFTGTLVGLVADWLTRRREAANELR